MKPWASAIYTTRFHTWVSDDYTVASSSVVFQVDADSASFASQGISAFTAASAVGFSGEANAASLVVRATWNDAAGPSGYSGDGDDG